MQSRPQARVQPRAYSTGTELQTALGQDDIDMHRVLCIQCYATPSLALRQSLAGITHDRHPLSYVVPALIFG
jgi:hypothetical protein